MFLKTSTGLPLGYWSKFPWRLGMGMGGYCVFSADGVAVASIRQDVSHDLANSCLIAAAPDLMRALENLMREWERRFGPLHENHEAMIALAKARTELEP